MDSDRISQKTSDWLSRPFYKDAVVMGVDIGIEGIGLCLRKGPEVIYNKTLLFDLPQAEALKDRRQKRAARHCRKNRKTRMHRLAKLFKKHGLPWPGTEELSKTDPYILRHRALTSKLASGHALGIAIRHVVLRRGYDFFANSEGEFPWGEDSTLAEAVRWLRTSHISDEVAAYLSGIEPELSSKACPPGREATDSALAKDAAERAAFHEALRARLAECSANDLESQLETYRRTKDVHVKAAIRGRNVPRSLLEEHLRTIIARHADLIRDVEGFTAALFLKPEAGTSAVLQRRAKEKAIFHFNRKTRAEAEALWERKTKDCPLAGRLGLPGQKAANADHPDIRKWRVLEFAATRRVEAVVVSGKGASKTERRLTLRLPAGVVAFLVSQVGAGKVSFSSIRSAVSAGLGGGHEGARPVADTRSPFNRDFFSQLRDLMCPTVANGRRKAGIGAGTAAHLFDVATCGGTDFSPDLINTRLNEIGFYDLRRQMDSGGPLFPQVRLLLGQRRLKGSEAGTWSVPGRLQRLFAEPSVAEHLDGKTAPDYLIIECVGDAPRNLAQRAEIQREQKERRETRDKLFGDHPFQDSGVASRRRRIVLFDQQRGRCPFTGLPLGDPLSPELDLEHLFPQSRGGLSTDANLVLTFRWVNQLKHNSTPREFAARKPHPGVLDWEGMKNVTRDFKWAARKSLSQPQRKRDLFEFEGEGFPDFGNTTFTAQLARQLVQESLAWMGVRTPEEQRLRIGTPSGWLAAQARRSWIRHPDGSPLAKDRDETQHHLVDALVLAHIPPAEGMNSVSCGGIFFSEWQDVEWQGVKTRRAVTRALPDLVPPSLLEKHLYPLLGSNPDTLPVEKHRARRKWASALGDSTFWRVDFKTGRAYQRTPLVRTDKDFTDAEAVLARLRLSRIPGKLLPARSQVERWLALSDEDTTGLLLADGTPVRSVWKACGKGNLSSPLGWTADPAGNGKPPKRFLNLSVKSECLEIWVAWNGRKWVFIKRRSPEKTALRHLLRFAGPWTAVAPAWMQDDPEKTTTHKTLEEIVCGNVLPAVAAKLPCGAIRKGDEFRVSFDANGKIRSYQDGLSSSWVTVSAIQGDLRIKVKPLLKLPDTLNGKQRESYMLGSLPELLALIGHAGDAAATACDLNLKAPTHDPSSHTGGQPRARTARPAGQADLWEP